MSESNSNSNSTSVTSGGGSTALGLGFFLTMFLVVLLVVGVVAGLVVVMESGDDGGTGSEGVGVGDGGSAGDTGTGDTGAATPESKSTPTPENGDGEEGGTGNNNGSDDGEQLVDSDNDGLSDKKERELGTDPENPDTDGDGLLDGWEVHGVKTSDECGVVPLDRYADPLRKDLFVQFRTQDSEVMFTNEEIRRFEEAFERYGHVSNPDGSEGVEVHSFRGRGSEASESSIRRSCLHGLFYFGLIEDEDELGASAYTPGSISFYSTESVLNSREDKERHERIPETGRYGAYPMFSTIVHEVGHNILGDLDEDHRADGDDAHSRFGKGCECLPYGAMAVGLHSDYFIHPEVWGEVERDGLKGLPEVSGWSVPGDADGVDKVSVGVFVEVGSHPGDRMEMGSIPEDMGPREEFGEDEEDDGEEDSGEDEGEGGDDGREEFGEDQEEDDEEDLGAAKAQLRHKSEKTTLQYDQTPVEKRKDALDRMG